MSEAAAIAGDEARPTAERVAALKVLQDQVDGTILSVAPALLGHPEPALASAALDALERLAFADPGTVEPVVRALASGPASHLPGWPRLLGTLASPWARERLYAQASGGAEPSALAARDELARLGERVAALAVDPAEAQHLTRTAATARALGALDAGRPIDHEWVMLLLESAGFSLLIKLLDAGLLAGESLVHLRAYEPPPQLPKAQRALARRLLDRLRTP